MIYQSAEKPHLLRYSRHSLGQRTNEYASLGRLVASCIWAFLADCYSNVFRNKKLLFIFFTVLFFQASAAVAEAWGGSKIEDLIRRGDEAFYERAYEKSEEFYSEAAEKKPREAVPHVLLGRLYYAMTRYSDAKREFEMALSLRPDALTRKFIETALKHMNAVADVLKRIESLPDTPDNRTQLVALHQTVALKMDRDGAYMAILGTHLRYLLDADPKNSTLRASIADAFYLSSDPMSAVVLYEELARLAPHNRSLQKRLADTYVSLGRFDQASVAYKKALREALREGNEAERVDLLRLLKTLPASFAKIQWIIEEDEDYPRAIAELKRRLDLNGYDLAAMVMMGTVYEEMEQPSKAEKLYKTALKIDPEYPYAHFYMGRFQLLEKKEFESAVEELNLFKEYLKEAGYRPGVTGKTREMILKDRVQASRYLAYIYGTVLNKNSAAVQELQKTLVLAPKDPELYYDLGVAYSGVKKRMSAFQCFKKVIELDPKSEIAKHAKEAMDIIRSYNDYGSYAGPYD